MLANSRFLAAIVGISFLPACSGGSSGGGSPVTGGAGGTGAVSGGGSGGTTSGGAAGSATGGAAGSATGGAAGSATGGAAGASGSGGVTTLCPPNSSETCYSGPPGTDGVGVCQAGTHTCDASGSAWGACTAEVLPGTQSCALPVLDDDCDGQLGTGCCVSGAWTTEVVDTNGTGIQNRIGVDAKGNVSIGYSELTQTSPTSYSASARFAHKPRGGSWSTETVSTAGSPATSVAFSLDPAGVGHEVYLQGTTTEYAIRTGPNAWSKYPAPSMGQSPNIVLDVRSGGAAHLAWRSDQVRYAWIDATGTKENLWISSSTAGPIHMAAHDNGSVYVMYATKACSGCSLGALVLYTKQPGGFSTLSLGSSTGYAGIAVDSVGDPHMVMSDAFGHFEYGSKKPGVPFSSAQCYIECPDPSGDIALAIDAQGQAHAAYVTGSGLRYVRRIGGTWKGETVAVGVGSNGDVSIALDSAGGVHLSYLDGTVAVGRQAYAYRCP